MTVRLSRLILKFPEQSNYMRPLVAPRWAHAICHFLILEPVSESPTTIEKAAVEPEDERGAHLREAHLVGQLQQRTVELESANRELRFLSNYRSLFLARMSHELRTPLTSILGFTEILLDQEKLTETQQRFCRKIQNSGMQLLTSLNQLVDLSRVEVGPPNVYHHEFSLNATLRESCAAVARIAQKQGVTLECDEAAGTDTIVSDQGRLRQILYTFLAWTISRSRDGQVVRIHAELLDGSLLRVEIDDEGEPVKDMVSVFDPDESDRAGKNDLNELGIIVGTRLLEAVSGSVSLENRESGLRTSIQVPVGYPTT